MSPVLIVIILISASLGALLAKSRNRTPWKGALVGALPITLLGMMIFLKTKGERTKKNKMIDRIIVGSFLLLIIGGAITKSVVEAQFNDTMAKYSYNKSLNEDGNKLIHYSMFHDTFIIELNVEEAAKQENVSYIQAENYYISNTTNLSQEMFDSFREEGAIAELKQVGYTALQVKVLYKDGTTKDSEIIELD
jgi:hypothetical protein